MAGDRNVAGRTDRHRALVTLRRHCALADISEVDVEPRIAVKDRHRAVARRGRQNRSRGWRRQDDRADRVDDAALVAGSKWNSVRLILEWRRDIDSSDRVAGKR